jgi:tetratricopeptide (TPR) repeat protein
MHFHRLLYDIAGMMVAIVLLGSFVPAQQPAPNSSKPEQSDWNPNDPDRQLGLQLYEQHKMSEAVPLLDKVVARYPKDMVAHERLGTSLLSRSDTQTDTALRKADRARARAELQRAKELGDNSDLCNMLLASLSEDGSDTSFSNRKEVDAAMQRGEAAFANGEWENAIKEYSRAFELDPKLYLAAVDIGDTYFRLKQMDKAGEWFARAIAINPNQEVAYRYWGDALLEEGKMKEAREKFIQGLVAFPYKGGSGSWAGLHNWLRRNGVKLKEVSIQLPQAPTKGAKGETVINIDPSTLDKKDDGGAGAAWMMYPMERALWQNEKFAKAYPKEKGYRHSLKEEASALSGVATVFEELQQKKKAEHPDPALVLLSQLKADGLIEAYVLLIKPDAGIAQDYPAYQAANRGKLIQFIDKYVVPAAP